MLTGWLAHPSIHPFIQSFVQHTCTPSPVGLAVEGGGGRAGQQEFPPPQAESSPNPHTSEPTKAPRGGVSVVSWLHRRCPGPWCWGRPREGPLSWVTPLALLGRLRRVLMQAHLGQSAPLA